VAAFSLHAWCWDRRAEKKGMLMHGEIGLSLSKPINHETEEKISFSKKL